MVHFDIRGRLAYGSDCAIGNGSILNVKHGTTLTLGNHCGIGRYVELGPDAKIQIGNDTSIQDRSILLGDVTLGSYCSLAPNVFISSGRHWFNLSPHELIKDQDRMVARDPRLSAEHSRPVTVGDDCWLGVNSVINPGVTIGKGAVVGANSVVTKDVNPYCVVAGAPARLVRKRLEFRPPVRIDAARPEDRPYFYSGFDLSRRSADDSRHSDGIAANGAFSLCLDSASGDHLHMVAKAAESDSAMVCFGGQRLEVSGSYSDIVFTLGAHRADLLQFLVIASALPAKLLVKSAWID